VTLRNCARTCGADAKRNQQRGIGKYCSIERLICNVRRLGSPIVVNSSATPQVRMLPLYYGAITQVRTLAVREKVFQRAGGFMRRSGQPFEKACQPTAFYHLVPARIGFLPFALIRHLADGVQPSLALARSNSSSSDAVSISGCGGILTAPAVQVRGSSVYCHR